MARPLVVTFLCLTALAVAFAASAAFTAACTTHQCDTSFVNIDQSTGTSVGSLQVLDPQTGFAMWESGPFDGTWIDYPGERTYFFGLPQYFTPLMPPNAYVATDATPNDADAGGGTYVEASGQLAEFGNLVNGGFLVTNATCADYSLYVYVLGTYSPPAPPDAGGAD